MCGYLCGLVCVAYVTRVCVCVCVCDGSDSFCQEAMKWHLRGQRSICSNPSSCQSVSLLAARCWWLPRVNTLDECPLEGKVTAWKTDHTGIVGRQAPNLLPHTDPCCDITLHVQDEALSATAGADTKSNDSCVALSHATGELLQSGSAQSSNVRDISSRAKYLYINKYIY